MALFFEWCISFLSINHYGMTYKCKQITKCMNTRWSRTKNRTQEKSIDNNLLFKPSLCPSDLNATACKFKPIINQKFFYDLPCISWDSTVFVVKIHLFCQICEICGSRFTRKL